MMGKVARLLLVAELTFLADDVKSMMTISTCLFVFESSTPPLWELNTSLVYMILFVCQ